MDEIALDEIALDEIALGEIALGEIAFSVCTLISLLYARKSDTEGSTRHGGKTRGRNTATQGDAWAGAWGEESRSKS